MRQLVARLVDVIVWPFTLLSSALLRIIRSSGVAHMPISKKVLNAVGAFPIQDHYYEPMFSAASLTKPLREDRHLPGVDLNVQEQLDVLKRFDYNDELEQLPTHKQEGVGFYYHNGYFESGDAEYLYNMVRLYRPSRLVEVGSGFSSLVAREAIRTNLEVNPTHSCDHICIEPYENKWLDNLGMTVIREPVQNTDMSLFQRLKENDILFIDSSHVIRPQGDVLCVYLNVLPVLAAGVLVHIHDIFTPKDYRDEWILDEVRFWNEQYLLEAFLSLNEQFKVIGALNFLAHNYRSELAAKCPIYKMEASYREPGSFWIMRAGE
jgi:methyltransferase family protein